MAKWGGNDFPLGLRVGYTCSKMRSPRDIVITSLSRRQQQLPGPQLWGQRANIEGGCLSQLHLNESGVHIDF